MTKFITIITMWIMLIGLSLFIISGCSSNEPTGNASGTYMVRVINAQADTISIVIGPADYGAIAPNDTSDYKEVNEGENTVWVNGQVFEGSPANFGNGPIHCRWTVTFGQPWHYDLDGCH